MENIIVAVILIVIVAAAGLYVYKAKKRGQKCIGCPYAQNCAGNCGEEKK